MRVIQLIHWATVLLMIISCSGAADNKATSTSLGENAIVKTSAAPLSVPSVNVEELVKDFQGWYSYTYTNVRLAQDFFPLDTDSGKLGKKEFLSRLLTGDFIPVKRGMQGTEPVYQLIKPNALSADVRSTVQQIAQTELDLMSWEGRKLPAYRFTDLEGKVVDASTSAGKLLMMKCWFINCVACVAEFPELNGLVEKYKDREDILFVSLATDEKERLVNFLKKKPFRYAVVPEQDTYLTSKLKVSAFPTHILVNRNGQIVKMTNAIEDILPFLERELVKPAGPDTRRNL